MDKYLLEILKESNTIIIPGLGALTVTNNETGETMFMPYLQHDDGKLAGFIAQKDGVDEADAKIMVAKYVREIQAELDKGESYSMFELGNFVKAADGDIEFTHWSNLTEKEDDAIIVPPVLPETVIADEPIVKIEPEIEESLENTPKPETTPIVEAIETPEIPKEIIPEIAPEPVEEVEVKTAIEEALANTSKPESAPIVEAIETPEIPKEIIPEIAPEPVEEKITPAVAVAALGGISIPENEPIDANTPKEQEAGLGEEQKAKDKPTPKFWITMIIIALLIIAGGAYLGRNYNELKQHIPFLADAKEVDKSNFSEDEAENNDEDTYTGDRYHSIEDENDAQEKTDAKNQNLKEEVETPVESKPETITKPKPAPVSRPTTSSSGHYHIIAGAFSSIDNANNLAKDFKAQGLPAKVIKNGELNAVSMQSYATSEDAHADLNKMNSIVKGAWILYK